MQGALLRAAPGLVRRLALARHTLRRSLCADPSPPPLSIAELVRRRRAAVDDVQQRHEAAGAPADGGSVHPSIRPFLADVELYLTDGWFKKFPSGARLRRLQRDIAFRMPLTLSDRRAGQPPKLASEHLLPLVELLAERGLCRVHRRPIEYHAPDGTELTHDHITVLPPEGYKSSAAPKAKPKNPRRRRGQFSSGWS